MKIVELTGTCDASGDLTLTAESSTIGYIEKIVMDYIDGDTGADLIVTNEDGTVTLYHSTSVTFAVTQCVKLIENQNGKGWYVIQPQQKQK